VAAFLRLKLGNFIIVHGFDENNETVDEVHTAEQFTEKLVSIDRIQSVTEKYILTTSSHNRVIYWEYEGTLQDIADKLEKHSLII